MIPIPKSLRWSWKIKPAPIPKPRLLHNSLTLDEWLENPSRVDFAKRMFSMSGFRAMLSVLHNEAPIPNPAAKPEALAGQAMLVAGYMQCLNTLLAMSVPPPIQASPPEATYEAPSPELTSDDDLG